MAGRPGCAVTAPNIMTHVFFWGKRPERLRLKGRRCQVLGRSRPASRPVSVYCSGRWIRKRMRWDSVLIEFDDGERQVVSRRALRRLPA